MNILITGAAGQLGRCLVDEAPGVHHIVAVDRDILDVTNEEQVGDFFSSSQFDLCINCAAYTAVDRAESDRDKAHSVNEEGAVNLAKACVASRCALIHLSTDYVYHSTEYEPQSETSNVNPQSVYAHSKLAGELGIQRILPAAMVLRTSWLFSEFGHNFFLTMRRLCRKGVVPNVVNDQFGSPTYARDLAVAIWEIVQFDPWTPGTYNVCNSGETTWHEFASEIFRLEHAAQLPVGIPTSEYPTAAKRPPYSVMSTEKIKVTYGITMRDWRDAVKACHSRAVQMTQDDN